MPETVGYRKRYTLRRQAPDKPSLEVTFPFEVVDREARLKGISVDEFLEQNDVEVTYGDNSDGVHYKFVPAK